jgi:PAS domain S-box-containing protein
MWIYDQETLAFLDANKAAQKRYGYNREEFLRLTILDIRPIEDIPKVLKSTLHPHKIGPQNHAPFRHKNKANEVFDVEVSTQEIMFQGRPAKLVLSRC